jgi:hypothetical protein
MTKFRQIEIAPSGEAKKRSSDFSFDNINTWPAPFISIIDELMALMFQGLHGLKLNEE